MEGKWRAGGKIRVKRRKSCHESCPERGKSFFWRVLTAGPTAATSWGAHVDDLWIECGFIVTLKEKRAVLVGCKAQTWCLPFIFIYKWRSCLQHLNPGLRAFQASFMQLKKQKARLLNLEFHSTWARANYATIVQHPSVLMILFLSPDGCSRSGCEQTERKRRCISSVSMT